VVAAYDARMGTHPGPRNRWRRFAACCLAVWLASCTVPPRTGWERDLRAQLCDVADRFANGAAILSGMAPPTADAPLAPGDQLLFGVSLETGAGPRTWYLRLQVVALEVGDGIGGRRQTPFERRVRPSAERQRQLLEQSREVWQAFRAMDPAKRWQLPCPRIRVDAFDAHAAPLATAESLVTLSTLKALQASCLAGFRQRATMRGRVALGDDAETLQLSDEDHDDVMCVAEGVGVCELLFRVLQRNPVTRDILYEVVALPTLWSIVTSMKVRMALSVDFFAARRVPASVYEGHGHELWSVPLTLLLNDQPALYAFVVTGAGGAPDRAAAGVRAIVARHPTDERRRVHVQLLASQRGQPATPPPTGTPVRARRSW
jgi:hypothetical protein